ncbi:glutaredoxin 2 [Pantoea sp. Nvir]|uniref:glutaredoxin 2 n=1 Tax=Pantoea sp. Nvir TaxID=2576760 RepID=UPI0027FD04E0|nr:glutaredoxin 2 [Pantoea sp. Nvir]CAJ0991526.1 Glutaredoxin 2 [Pantoea sp. Nvir]
MKLYIYDHCPFCVKARMIFGLKNLPVELIIMRNDDEETPTMLIGQKMVPILQKNDGSVMPESLDIVRFIDKSDGKPLLMGKTNPEINAWLAHVNSYINKLLFPCFAKASFVEFANPEARDYFRRKKEASAGNFFDLERQKIHLIKNISNDLKQLDKIIVKPNAVNSELSEDDIHLFPLLRSLTLVASIDWPNRVAEYRDNMAVLTQINLLFNSINSNEKPS